MKVTKEQIKRMKELRKEGLSFRKIATIMGIKWGTVGYHLDKESRKKSWKKYWYGLPIEKRRKIRKRYHPYIREYQKRRYQEDEEYREKQKQRVKEYYKRKKSNSKPIEEVKGGKE